jgi:glycosyltransferase involved in cell wall biosynthesis
VTRLRVGVNLLWLLPGAVGGSEESMLAAVRAVRDHAPDEVELRLFVLDSFRAAHPDLVASLPTDVLRLRGDLRPVRILSESSWLARRSRGLDLVHHMGGTVPPVRSAPAVLTVHDLQPLERQATHGRLKRAYLGLTIPPSVRAARCTITPSEYVRCSVLSHTGVDPSRVVVIPHSRGHRPAAASAEAVAERYQLDGPVILYPTITYPHKNHLVLLEAFAHVLRHHPRALLVLTGGAAAAEAEVLAAVDRLGIAERVRRPGRVPAADLMALYDAATVLAWPSRYEGFGVPIAEAMSRGLPVVAARSTALPEVVGDAGVLVDPDDPAAWATALGGLLDDPAERARLVEAGRVRAHRWDPPEVSRLLVEAYQQAAGGRGTDVCPPGGLQ